jgi:DNA-binding NtrC family response regulator
MGKEKDILRRKMERLAPFKLKDIEHCWIEIMIDRTGGNRRQAAKQLGISMCKLRRYITYKKIDVDTLIKVGRPKKKETTH